MKLQKMDSKQVAQVVVLGLLSAGVLGYAALQFLGSGSRPANASAAQAPGLEQAAAAPGAPGADGSPAPEPAAPGKGVAPAGLGTTGAGYNPDPFRSPVEPKVQGPPPAPGPRVQRDLWPGNPGSLPNPGGEVPGGPVLPGGPIEPAVQRPTLAVTGIIDVEGGTDMALVEVGSASRIVQVGDLVDTYKVKKIDMSGLVLVNGKDRYFVALASTEGAKS